MSVLQPARRRWPWWLTGLVVLGSLLLLLVGIAVGFRQIGITRWREACAAERAARRLSSVAEIVAGLGHLDHTEQQAWQHHIDGIDAGPHGPAWERFENDLLGDDRYDHWSATAQGELPAELRALHEACRASVDETLALLTTRVDPCVNGGLLLLGPGEPPWHAHIMSLRVSRNVATWLAMDVVLAAEATPALRRLDAFVAAHAQAGILIDAMILVALIDIRDEAWLRAVRKGRLHPRQAVEWMPPPVPLRPLGQRAMQGERLLFLVPLVDYCINDGSGVGIGLSTGWQGRLSGLTASWWAPRDGLVALELSQHWDNWFTDPHLPPPQWADYKDRFWVRSYVFFSFSSEESVITLIEHEARQHATRLALDLLARQAEGQALPADQAALDALLPGACAPAPFRVGLAYERAASGFRFSVDVATPAILPGQAGRYARLRRVLADAANPEPEPD